MNPLIPVTIVTGFLGSGKTTLLTSLVKSRQSRRLALLINEFGEVSVDGMLVSDAGNDTQVSIHEFSHGLIAYGDDELFIPTMLAIAERRAVVDHVLIETSGLALPTAVMESLQTPQLAASFILDATLVVVDTPLLLSNQFERGLSELDKSIDVTGSTEAKGDPHQAVSASVANVFEQQLAAADVVVLNKIDELDEDALLSAEARVRQCAPNVRFLELAYHAKLDIRLALGLRLHQPGSSLMGGQPHVVNYTALASMPDGDSTQLNQSRLNGHSHSGLASHMHGLATHKHFHEQDPGWQSFVLRSQLQQQPELVKVALAEAAKAEPILRTKGFVRTADSTLLVQGVRSRIAVTTNAGAVAYSGKTLSGSGSGKTRSSSELVFIGYHVNRARLVALLSEMTGTAWK